MACSDTVGNTRCKRWTSYWGFTTVIGPPTIPNPPTNSKGIPVEGTCSWNKITLADSFRLQVSTTTDFAKTIINIANIPDSMYKYSGLNYATKYYWRVGGK